MLEHIWLDPGQVGGRFPVMATAAMPLSAKAIRAWAC